MGPSLAMASFFIPQWLRTITVAGEQMQSFVNALADNENAWLITEKQSGACIGYVTMDIPYPQLAIGEIGYCDWREIPEEGRGQMREEILRKR